MAEGPLSQTLSVDRADPHPLGKGGHLGAYRLYGVQHHHICPGTGPIHQRSAGDAPQTALGLFLDRHYPDQRIERVYPNAKIVD